jgi:hypothetical protein
MAGFFSNIFGTTSASPDAPAAQAPAPVAAPLAAQPTVPAVATSTAPESPLDQFKSLWEPNATPQVDGTLPANMFAGADPAKMLEAARKVDFSKSIPPDVLAKITAGGPDAAAAFAAALNDVSQRAYAQSSFASTKIVEAALAKFQEGLDSRLPGQIKRHAVSDSIRESNPALMHPAAAPIMEAMQSQLAVKYPNATVSEIKDMATQYLTAFNTAASPKPVAQAVPANEDWGKFFS